MMKKAIVLTAILAMAASAGAQGVLFESFEDGTGGLFTTGVEGVSTTVGVTDGIYSAYGDPPTGWNAKFQTGWNATVSGLLSQGWIISVDVTLPEAVPPGTPAQIWFLLDSSNGGTGDVGYISLTGGGVTDTVQYDYSGHNIDFATATWGQVRIGTNMGTNDFERIYIDNVRVIPEPATLTLIGMGALALLRRRRS